MNKFYQNQYLFLIKSAWFNGETSEKLTGTLCECSGDGDFVLKKKDAINHTFECTTCKKTIQLETTVVKAIFSAEEERKLKEFAGQLSILNSTIVIAPFFNKMNLSLLIPSAIKLAEKQDPAFGLLLKKWHESGELGERLGKYLSPENQRIELVYLDGTKQQLDHESLADAGKKAIVSLKFTKTVYYEKNYEWDESDYGFDFAEYEYERLLESGEDDRGFIPAYQPRDKIYCNPFDELEAYPDAENFRISTSSEYDNRFMGYLNNADSKMMMEWWSNNPGAVVYHGQRKIVEFRYPEQDVKSRIEKVKEEWNCSHSIKIQQWYMENNTEYRAAINAAADNPVTEYEEIIFSTQPVVKIKEIIIQKVNIHELPFSERIYTYKDKKRPEPKAAYTGPTVTPYYEPSDQERAELMTEDSYRMEYYHARSQFNAENPYDNYDDYLYFERLRDGEE
ncbi:hypothetical protein J7I80_20680 [Bacillus sp. ISL-41]|uniref:hypothetical protein n=1 Tax=Bacillus sp. ISL-41 TaxID=2819127 RepID=UPI001BE6B77D|nr:hypothetical protein [Bacillus sp. ISL-41]MBT2644636.1 hypothetical protein [Bacillus sp. ISL-41]